ncbi:MotA/TolQ/ExbB proton channel family protein [Thiomicrorhabdus sp. ZW0627]|uniref:motility-associated protein n=1 Tax=Thiomicrorhabdus sp. ZW0627 TaxID=3039774 RepID=UPI0024364522|nr:motility-associated protein [Thiomicrorhabdus sp. ZW0627]MDG6774792.1 MotA/TolQ/ExbB proton channel family protein [Thiomicrorhabdus sp. ZW0627]
MFAKPIGIIIILLSLLGGFVLMGGKLGALWHPSELVVILGISLGAYLASTPVYIWMRTLTYIGRFFAGERVNKKLYAETLGLLEELARLSRSSGMLVLEKHIVSPENSPIFMHYSQVMKHPSLKKFIVDNFSYMLLNPPASLNFQHHLENQIDDIYQSMMEVPKALGKVADWLPGFGIVAAVLGVIITMEMLGGEMDVAKIGTAIGAALVGTLTGVFVAFAVVAPFVHSVEVMIRQDRSLFEMAAAFIEAYESGVSPNLAVEIGRQRVPPEFEVPRDEGR